MSIFQLPSPLHKIENKLTLAHSVELFLKRDDLIHPEVSGNKWRKLKYNLEQAKRLGKDTLLTFGGAYSNHITATAAAGKQFGLKTIGVIRGEEYFPLNKSLQFAKDAGMQLLYADRTSYKDQSALFNTYRELYPDAYIMQEGGANKLAVNGCKEITDEIEIDFDFICCACGTGTTCSGIASNLKSNQKAIAFPVLRNGAFIGDEIKKWGVLDFELITDYHFGGYAKITPELVQFIKDFHAEQNILLDYVYTGKLLFAIFDLIEKKYFPKNSTIIAVHTGGVANANVFDL